MASKPSLWTRFRRLFVIKTKFDACLVIYALAMGALERGHAYLQQYPGTGGYLLMLAATGSVFLAGAKIFDCLRHEAGSATHAVPAPAFACANDNDPGKPLPQPLSIQQR